MFQPVLIEYDFDNNLFLIIKTNDGLVIVTKMNDYKQRPIIVAIKENGDAWKDNVRYKAHVITSIYGRKNFLDWIKKQNIIWRE